MESWLVLRMSFLCLFPALGWYWVLITICDSCTWDPTPSFGSICTHICTFPHRHALKKKKKLGGKLCSQPGWCSEFKAGWPSLLETSKADVKETILFMLTCRRPEVKPPFPWCPFTWVPTCNPVLSCSLWVLFFLWPFSLSEMSLVG